MHLKEGHNLICTKVWNFIGATKYAYGPVFYYVWNTPVSSEYWSSNDKIEEFLINHIKLFFSLCPCNEPEWDRRTT